MMSNLAKDIKTAVNLFLDMRQARKSGSELVLEKNRSFPIVHSDGFYNTVEGCVLNHLDNKIGDKAQEAFDALPDEVKYQLMFAPKSGEFKDRTNLWKEALKPVMTES